MLWKNRNKKVGLCVMIVMASLALVTAWAVLTTSETALAAKPVVLHGSATFRDDPNDPDDPIDPFDRVCSDGGGPYTDAGTGKSGGTVLGLGNFFRLQAKLNKKGEGRSFDLDFDGLGLVDFEPDNPYFWELYVQGTLAEWRAQGVDGNPNPVLRDGRLNFGTKGVDAANINYGAGSSWGGAQLTVTRTGTDEWTIESFNADEAQLWRQGESFGFFPMPFKITYVGE